MHPPKKTDVNSMKMNLLAKQEYAWNYLVFSCSNYSDWLVLIIFLQYELNGIFALGNIEVISIFWSFLYSLQTNHCVQKIE